MLGFPRVITREMGIELAARWGCPQVETSARLNTVRTTFVKFHLFNVICAYGKSIDFCYNIYLGFKSEKKT